MSLSLSELRRCRGTAKGVITRIGRELTNLQAADAQRMSIGVVDKYLEQITKFDEAFQTHHSAILREDAEIVEEQHIDELVEHERIVNEFTEILTGIRHRYDAFKTIRELTLAWMIWRSRLWMATPLT